MSLNLFSNEKLHLLALLKNNEDYDLEHLLEQFFSIMDFAQNEEEFMQLFEARSEGEFYDIVVLEYNDEKTFDLIDWICKINQAQSLVLFIEENKHQSIIKALKRGVNTVIPTPIGSKMEMLSPLLKLITFKNNEKDLKFSNYLIRQKDKIIDENVFMTISDLKGNIVNISQAYSDFTGYSKEELIGKNHNIFRQGHYDKKMMQSLWKTLNQDLPWQGEFQNNKKNGERFVVRSTITPLRDQNGEKIGYLNIINDITNVKRLEELSITDALTNLYNRRYFDFITQKEFTSVKWRRENFGLVILDVDHFKKYNDFYGHAEGDKVLQKIAKVLKKCENNAVDYAFRIGGEEFALIALNRSDEDLKASVAKIIHEIEALKIPHSQNDTSKYVTISAGTVNIPASQLSISYEALYNIADENLYKAKRGGRNRFVFEMEIDKFSEFKNIDPVTKLPNRMALLNNLALLNDEAMLIILHVNQLKSLQDLYGYESVEKILKNKAATLKEAIKDEAASLYNLNMEEFAILVTEKDLFNKYLELLKYYLLSEEKVDAVLDNESCTITNFTAGVAYGILNLFHNADVALQEALLLNKKLSIFDKNDFEKEKAQISNVEKLKVYKKALLEDRIIPFFQPIVDVKDNTIHKYEALARIRLEDGTIISPAMFLDSAKVDKTYEYFSRQLIQKVFNIYAKNQEEFSINLTYQNIVSESMIAYIENRLQKYGGENITFEIVETDDIKEYKRIEEFIKMIKKYGAKISIDDFGSGYSNFTNLIQFHLDYIKLDGTLIEQLLHDQNVENMIQAIISFAHKADIKVIAEFVSTKALDEKVRELGVDYIQGYLYGEPKAPEEYGLVTKASSLG